MILVTGGTGAIGGKLLRLLSQAGVPARLPAATHTRRRHCRADPSGIAGDCPSQQPCRSRSRVPDAILLTRYYEDMVELQHNAIVAARAAGVSHVVKVSALPPPTTHRAPVGRWHYESRRNSENRGWVGRFSASSFYAEPSWPARLHRQGAVHSASGDGKIPYVDCRDVAAVAFVTLTQPGHLDKTYVVTGSEAISYREAAEIIGAAIGKRLRFIDESPDEARRAAFEKDCRLPWSRAPLLSPPISAPAGSQ